MTSFDLDLSKYSLGWSDDVEYAFAPEKGLNDRVVEQISWWKGEPEWMRKMRLRSLTTFDKKPMAEWFAVNMPELDFQDIFYYLKPATEQVSEWDDLPEQMRNTYEKLGIPEAERKYLAGVTAQYESEVVFHRNREDLEKLGILFCDMDTALREYPTWSGVMTVPKYCLTKSGYSRKAVSMSQNKMPSFSKSSRLR